MSKEMGMVPYDNSPFKRLLRALQGLKDKFKDKNKGTSFPEDVLSILRVEAKSLETKIEEIKNKEKQMLLEFDLGRTIELSQQDLSKFVSRYAANKEEKEQEPEKVQDNDKKPEKVVEQKERTSLGSIKKATKSRNKSKDKKENDFDER